MITKRVWISAATALIVLALAPSTARTETRSDASAAFSYFPLEVGNQWVYKRTALGGSEHWRVTVDARLAEEGGPVRFALDGYLGSRRTVHSGMDGNVTELRLDGSGENFWYLLDSSVGKSWELRLDNLLADSPLLRCVHRSELILASRTETVEVPAGSFRDVIRIDFTSFCSDAGIVSEWFAPGIGLVRRVESSFAGPIVSELVHAEVGDLVLPVEAYSTSLSLEKGNYVNNFMAPGAPDAIATLQGIFVLRNDSSDPSEFTFAGCKSVSISVVNDRGQSLVTTRADDGGCCMCENLLRLVLAEDKLAMRISFELATPDGKPLPDGRYGVISTLDSLDAPPLRPSATAMIEVHSVYPPAHEMHGSLSELAATDLP